MLSSEQYRRCGAYWRAVLKKEFYLIKIDGLLRNKQVFFVSRKRNPIIWASENSLFPKIKTIVTTTVSAWR